MALLRPALLLCLAAYRAEAYITFPLSEAWSFVHYKSTSEFVPKRKPFNDLLEEYATELERETIFDVPSSIDLGKGPLGKVTVGLILTAILVAISPVLFTAGLAAFGAVVTYCSCLSLVMLNVKIAMNIGYPYPCAITATHMFCTAIASFFVDPRTPSTQEAWQFLPVASVAGITMVLGNIALEFGGVAFCTMVACCTPAATFVVEHVLSGRQQTFVEQLPGIFLVCIGGMCCVSGQGSEASLLSLIFALSAVATRSVKFVWMHDLLKKSVSPARIVFWTCIWSFVPTCAIMLYSEGLQGFYAFRRTGTDCHKALLIATVASSVLAITQVIVLKYLGPITQSVVGNLNVVLVIVLAMLWLHEEVSRVQLVGVFVLMSGTILAVLRGGDSHAAAKLAEELPLNGSQPVPSKFTARRPDEEAMF
jgi:drug/metabolite transporter (DMT)-like permease